MVKLYSVSVLNKPGEGARILGALRDAGVNLIAFWSYIEVVSALARGRGVRVISG